MTDEGTKGERTRQAISARRQNKEWISRARVMPIKLIKLIQTCNPHTMKDILN